MPSQIHGFWTGDPGNADFQKVPPNTPKAIYPLTLCEKISSLKNSPLYCLLHPLATLQGSHCNDLILKGTKPSQAVQLL